MRGALALSRFCTLLLLALSLGGMGASTASAHFAATGERAKRRKARTE